ncbi:MAG: alpha/beta hydrolase [Bdellovibrionales bacterium]|nr:alpha/beta hydrolase [Bdellovibrionales bacterium]
MSESAKTILILLLVVLSGCVSSQTAKKVDGRVGLSSYDAELTNYAYPFEVKTFEVEAQRQKLKMAYMDLAPAHAAVTAVQAAPVIVLLHGKNFGGFYYEEVAKRLASMGYRVLIPDQVGFGKSTKPRNFQYSFQQLATMTQALLKNVGVESYTLVGHSMGGMLATRMALMYPESVQKLILINPIGLEDWKTMTGYMDLERFYQNELKTSPESIKRYQSEAYYSGGWKPEYDALIEVASGWTRHADYPLVAWNSALTFDMIFTQPVVYEFGYLKMPTALIIGLLDKTALGKAWAPESMKAKMGNYPQLGRKVSRQIPKAKLFELKGVGHVPFIEDVDQFFKEAMVPALKNF